MPEISVILPLERDNPDITKILYSLLHQNYQDFEIIVVSNKNIKLNFNNLKIKHIVAGEKNNIPELLNKGIYYVNSNLICFLNPNDLLLFDAIKQRYDKFLKNPNIIACYGLGLDIDLNYGLKQNNNYSVFYDKSDRLPNNNLHSILSREITPTISSLMIRKEILKNLEFDENYEISYDWEFFIRLFTRYEGSIVQLHDPIYISKADDTIIEEKGVLFLIRFLRESLDILDNFFGNWDVDYKYNLYKNLYLCSLCILIEYFPNNYWLRFYLLTSYLLKNKHLDNKLFDFGFISIIINSLISLKQPIFDKKSLLFE